MKIKRTLTSIHCKNMTLFLLSISTGLNAALMIWRLTIEPYYTNQITTLTWFGVIVLIASINICVASWSAFWSE